jgi:hypothetical protein
MSTLTSRTLTSTVSNRLPRPGGSRVPTSGVFCAVVSLKTPQDSLGGRLHDLLLLGVAREARLGLEVAVHGVWGDEDQAVFVSAGPVTPPEILYR